jgi:dihydroneopterin aldolase
MLSNNSLFDLISKRFDTDDMEAAFLDKIDDLIDYNELAESIVEEHESEISSMIAEMAEDALR